MELPRITVLDKDFRRLGEVGAPESFTATPRHMLAGTGSITIAADAPLAADLLDAGGAIGPRILVEYRGEELLSGWVGIASGQGPRQASVLTFAVDGYFNILYDLLAWPNPAGGIDAQGGDGGFWTASGPAETVAKNLIRANAQRLGIPLAIEPDQGRGATIDVQARFTRIADVLLEKVEAAGIGLRVTQAGAGYRLEAYVPTVWGKTLTEASGSVVDWAWNKKPAQATRVVVGGSGARELRAFRAVTNTALEAAGGRIREHFTDGNETINPSTLDNIGSQYLTTNGPALGLSVSLQESHDLVFGGAGGLHVGDKVSLEVGPNLIVEDILREATLSWTADQGVAVDQKVGDQDPEPTAVMIKRIAQLGTQLRTLKAGR